MAYHIPAGNIVLAATGSTGNNTHAGVSLEDADGVAIAFIVEAAGATPTVTFKVQGALEDSTVADSAANWIDLAYLPSSGDTPATTTQTATAVGATVFFLDFASGARFYRRFRLVTSANTNITYRANAYKRVEN